MSDDPSRRPMFYAYALLTGLAGGMAMTYFFTHQQQGVSLPTVLMFTLVATIMSYLTADVRIYLSSPTPGVQTQVPLEPEGMMLLGLALTSGPAAGSWAALIVGLVADVMSPQPQEDWRQPSAMQWVARAAAALLGGGRNIIAVSVAWLAYRGVGGNPTSILSDAYQATAMGVLCIVYALVRYLWKQGTSLALGEKAEQSLETFLAELLPLLITPLIAVSFTHLGRQFFLLLVLVLIGTAALLRQMSVVLERTREQAAVASFANRVRREFDGAQDPDTLCAIAHRLCTQVTPVDRFELGLFSSINGTASHVHIKVAVEEGKKIPPMRLPLTPMWQWLNELEAPLLLDEEQLTSLPFELPPIGTQRHPTRSAIFAPIPHPSHTEGDDSPVMPLGAIAMLSTRSESLTAGQARRVAIIARQLGESLSGLSPAIGEHRGE